MILEMSLSFCLLELKVCIAMALKGFQQGTKEKGKSWDRTILDVGSRA